MSDKRVLILRSEISSDKEHIIRRSDKMAGSLGGNLFEFPMFDNLPPLPPMPQWSNLPGPTAPLPELDPEELFNEVTTGTGSQGSPGSLQSSDSGVGSPEGSFPPESPGHLSQTAVSSSTAASVPLGDVASPVVSSSLPDVVSDSADVVVLSSTSDEQQTSAQVWSLKTFLFFLCSFSTD